MKVIVKLISIDSFYSANELEKDRILDFVTWNCVLNTKVSEVDWIYFLIDFICLLFICCAELHSVKLQNNNYWDPKGEVGNISTRTLFQDVFKFSVAEQHSQ